MKLIVFLLSFSAFCCFTSIIEALPAAADDPPKIPSNIGVLGYINALPNLKRVSDSLKKVTGNLKDLGKSREKLKRLTGSTFLKTGLSLDHLASVIPSGKDANGELSVIKVSGINDGFGRVSSALNRVSEHIELILKGTKPPKDDTSVKTGFKKVSDGSGALAEALSKIPGIGGAAFGFAMISTSAQKGFSDLSAVFKSIGNKQEDSSDKSSYKAVSSALLKVADAIEKLTKFPLG